MSYPKLELYFFESCPYCQMVMEVIDDLDLKVEYRDIRKEDKHLKQLLQDTGRRTVPCMYIDGRPMHESSDIMKWLERNQENLEKIS